MPEINSAANQERRRKAGEYLKMADKLFKAADYDGANRLVLLAMQTDPRNPYAIAYQERIVVAIETRDGSSQKKKQATPAKAKPATLSPQSRETAEDDLRKHAEEEARLQAIVGAKRRTEENLRRNPKRGELPHGHGDGPCRKCSDHSQTETGPSVINREPGAPGLPTLPLKRAVLVATMQFA